MSNKKAFLAGECVAVTGGSGFIGRALVQALFENGAEISVLSRRLWGNFPPGVKEFIVDIVSGEGLLAALKNIKIVFHLAGKAGPACLMNDAESFFNINTRGTENVLKTAKACGATKFIQASSSEVYGLPKHKWVNENHPLAAENPYAASKIESEKIVSEFTGSSGLETVIFRLFNVYGPGQSDKAFIGKLARQLAGCQPLILGSLSAARDFTYIKDVTEAFLKAGISTSANGKILNIGSGRKYFLKDVVKLGLRLSGREVGSSQITKKEDYFSASNKCLVADATLARIFLGWQATTTIEEGLKTTIDWAKAQNLAEV